MNEADKLTAAGLTKVEITTLSRHFFDNMSMGMIAREEDVSRGAVGQRITSALAKIKAAGLPAPQVRRARHVRREHRATCEPVDPTMFGSMFRRPGRRGYYLGRPRVVDCVKPS